MENERIKLEIDQPIFLNDPHRFWMVTSGEVDVFCVAVDENDEFSSGLKYLYSAGKGELLFSMVTEQKKLGYKLYVKSQGASLYAVDKSKLLSIDHHFLKLLIEKWIAKNVERLCNDNPPRVHEMLDRPGVYELKKGKKAYPSRGVVWGLLEEGQIWKYGEGKKGSAQEDLNYYFAISNHLWVQTGKNPAKLKVVNTREVLKDEIFFMLALNNLQNYFYERMVATTVNEQHEEDSRIEEKFSAEQNKFEKTLYRIGNIINGNKSNKNRLRNLSEQEVDNNLFQACQLIGDAIDFQFEVPKYLESYNHSTTNQLFAIAQASKARVRKIILRGIWWKDENGHLLAFRKDSKSPVALIQQSSGIYLLKDPETKEETVVNHEVAASLEPISYMFFYGFGEQMNTAGKLLSFALQGVKKDAKYLIMAAFAGSVIGLLIPILSGIIFDDVIPTADKSLYIEIFMILIVIAFVTAGLQLTQGVLQLRVEAKSSINAQAGVMDHLMRLPVTFYKKYSAGDLTSRAMGIDQIRQILSSTVLTAVLSGTFSIVNLILLFYYDVSLAWIGLALVVVAVIFVSIVGWSKLRYDRQISDKQGELQGFLYEFLTGIAKIRNTAGEKRIFSLWAQRFSNLKQLGFLSGSQQNLVETFNKSYPLLTNIFFFSFIYYTVSNSNGLTSMITVGAFMAFITAFNRFLNDALRMSLTLINSLQVATLYERVQPILNEVPESNTESTDPGELSGDIEMNSVSFRYHEDQPLILKDVSFKVKPGEMVAFVGPSGSGKSTVMRLLLGFEEAENGSVYYDGESFESMNKELVRKQIGVVLQNGALMAGSIYENIVGNSDLTLDDAWEAARLAGMEEDIKHMPMEMHTVVSEGGGTFSGGQRQRLMIARAIVHKPRLIFMDEATSALDNRTQSIVSESLEKLQATRIVIAHRLSTIEKADRIYVLDKGEIVEFGSYTELMEQDGTFSKLAKRQTV
ncbi:MAG: NHLP bacteriocin export ABC transporter permease/ATPase subunit [Bacteroidota bacterium]